MELFPFTYLFIFFSIFFDFVFVLRTKSKQITTSRIRKKLNASNISNEYNNLRYLLSRVRYSQCFYIFRVFSRRIIYAQRLCISREKLYSHKAICSYNFFAAFYADEWDISQYFFNFVCITLRVSCFFRFVGFFSRPVPYDLNGVNGMRMNRMGFRFQELQVFSLYLHILLHFSQANDLSFGWPTLPASPFDRSFSVSSSTFFFGSGNWMLENVVKSHDWKLCTCRLVRVIGDCGRCFRCSCFRAQCRQYLYERWKEK